MAIMQCKTYDPRRLKLPVCGQEKMNGIFGRWDAINQKFYTRRGNVIRGLSMLEAGLKYRLTPSFDGELVIPDMDFFEMNGLIRSHNETPTCVYHIFDMPREQRPLCKRLQDAAFLVSYTDQRLVKFVPYTVLHTFAAVDEFYKEITTRGGEGVVYKQVASMYRDGKNWDIQKRVPEFDTECKIIRLIEGTKSFTGMLGAFVVDYKGHLVKVGMGKGMDHAFRRSVWHNQDEYLGRMLKVSYKSVTAKGSLQSPKYICVRWDI